MNRKILIITAALMGAFGMAYGADYTVGEGEVFSLTSENNKDATSIRLENGATVQLQSGTGMVYARIVADGAGVAATIRNPSGSSASTWHFANGLRISNGAKITLDGVSTLQVGRASLQYGHGDRDYPVCDIGGAVFTAASPSVELREKTTVRSLPTGVPVSVVDGAIVALQGGSSLLPFFSSESNSLSLDKYDVIVLTGASLPTGCKVSVPVGRTFTFRPGQANGWDWTDVSASTAAYCITLGGEGAKVGFRGTNAKVTNATQIGGRGEIVIASENEGFETVLWGRRYNLSDATTPIVLSVDDKNILKADGWKKKVAHWFDADKAETVTKLAFDPNAAFGWTGAKNEFNGHPIVIGWEDAVKGADDYFLYNSRIWDYNGPLSTAYVLQVMPYLVEGGLNGKNYISFGKLNTNVAGGTYNSSGALASANETRRLRVWKGGDSGVSKPSGNYANFESPYCMMVFNSANGGGKAILGTDDSSTGNLARNSSSTSQPWVAYDGFAMDVDGETIAPKTAKPSGGWQIVALDMTTKSTLINAIGRHRTDANSGGQDYAEIIFFTEKPTAEERFACAWYLADKWGLTSQYSRSQEIAPYVTVSAGENATITLAGESDVLSVEGRLAGSINIPAGATVSLAKPLPPTEEDVPADGRVGWFDPSFDGALTYHTASGHTDEMQFLYGRTRTEVQTENGVKLRGSANGSGGRTRSPHVKAAARGTRLAASRPWLDFANTDIEGNTIRMIPSTGSESTGATSLTIRQGFVALDSCNGGGNPIGDNVEFSSGKIKRRKGNDCSAPIWSPSNTIAMTSTWLDTQEVDGTTQGFSGCPEVLSFTTAADYGAAYFGDYNGNKGNYEVLGEILLYSKPLAEAQRTIVQEYLMYKWFGDLNGKYADLASASVTGEGTLSVASFDCLPTSLANFTGTVAFDGTNLALHAARPVTVSAAVTLPESVSVAVTLGGKLKEGTYPLLTATSLAGATNVSAAIVDPNENYRYRIVRTETGLALKVTGGGLSIIIR